MEYFEAAFPRGIRNTPFAFPDSVKDPLRQLVKRREMPPRENTFFLTACGQMLAGAGLLIHGCT